MKVDDVGLLELPETCDIGTCIGKVYLKEMPAREVASDEDDESLPKEVPAQPWRMGEDGDSQGIGLFVAYQHLRLDTVVVQGFRQTVGCYGSPSGTFTGVDNQNPHEESNGNLRIGFLLAALLLLSGFFLFALGLFTGFFLLTLLLFLKFAFTLALLFL